MTYEGKMGDERGFDERAVETGMEIFLESFGLKRSK